MDISNAGAENIEQKSSSPIAAVSQQMSPKDKNKSKRSKSKDKKNKKANKKLK